MMIVCVVTLTTHERWFTGIDEMNSSKGNWNREINVKKERVSVEARDRYEQHVTSDNEKGLNDMYWFGS